MKELFTELSLDKIDLSILRELQKDGRISNSELARRISLSQPAAHTRIKRLEATGFIDKTVSLLNRDKLGLDLLCFIHIQLRAHSEEALVNFQKSIDEMPEVLECFHLTGQYDYLMKVIFKNRSGLEQFLRTKLVPKKEINQISTSVVLLQIKSTTVLPLPDD